MLRTFSALAFGALLVGTASAAPAPPASATCASNKYLDQTTGTCKPCTHAAKTCTSATVSTSCVSPYYLTTDGRCVANGECPTSTFANQSNGKCDKCFNSSYKTCSNDKLTSATSCVPQHCLSEGRCTPFALIKNTSYCDSNGAVAPCPGNGASTCTIDGTTLSCNAPYFLNSTVPGSTNTSPPTGRNAAPGGRRKASIGGTCVLASKSCSEGQFYDSYSDSGVETCRDTAVVASDGVTILPALYGDAETMKCLQCRGGNAYRCDPVSGYAAYSCYGSYSSPMGVSDSGTNCLTADACLNLEPERPGSTRTYQVSSLPEDFAAALPEADRFLGGCGELSK